MIRPIAYYAVLLIAFAFSAFATLLVLDAVGSPIGETRETYIIASIAVLISALTLLASVIFGWRKDRRESKEFGFKIREMELKIRELENKLGQQQPAQSN